MPGLVGLMRDLAARKVRLVEVETQRPSPFARSLLFGYVGAFLYEGDAPLAERRAAALALDSTLLGELLGRVELRELLDPAVVTETERQLQWLTDRAPAPRRRRRGRAAPAARRPVTDADLTERGAVGAWAERAGRRPPGAAGPDRRRGALDRRRGRRPGPRRARRGAAGRRARGLPGAGRRPARRPGRPLRPHPRAVRGRHLRGPVRARRLRGRAGAAAARPRPAGSSPASSHPGGAGSRVVRRRGAAAAAPPVAGRAAPGDRAGAAPGAGHVPAPLAAGRLVGARCRGGRGRRSSSCRAWRCRRRRWSGWCCRPGSPTTRPRYLDELCASGEVVWAGGGAIAGGDGWVTLAYADTAPLLLPVARRGAGADPAARRRCWTRSATARRCSSAPSPTGSARPTTPSWSPRCGTWSGPATSPTTPSRRCARCSAAAARTGPRPSAPRTRYRRPGRAAHAEPRPARRRSPAAGTGCPTATPTRPGAPPPSPTCCWNGTAWSPAARWWPRA